MAANSIQCRDVVMAGYADADRILAELEKEWFNAENTLATRMMVGKMDPAIQKELKKRSPDAFNKVMGAGGKNGR